MPRKQGSRASLAVMARLQGNDAHMMKAKTPAPTPLFTAAFTIQIDTREITESCGLRTICMGDDTANAPRLLESWRLTDELTRLGDALSRVVAPTSFSIENDTSKVLTVIVAPLRTSDRPSIRGLILDYDGDTERHHAISNHVDAMRADPAQAPFLKLITLQMVMYNIDKIAAYSVMRYEAGPNSSF